MSASSPPMSVKSPTLHATIWFTILVFAAILVMACIFKVEIVARGQGKVVPIGRVQVIQPEFDGKVTAIHVQNGDHVAQGDVLIELDATDTEAELNTIIAEQERLEIERARISTFLQSFEDDQVYAADVLARFDAATKARTPYYFEQARLLEAEVANRQAVLAQFDARSLTNDQSVEVTRANIARIDAAIVIQEERLAVAQDLLDRGTSSRAAFLDVQDAFTALEKEREVYLQELEQKIGQETALRAEAQSLKTGLRNDLLQRRNEIQARLVDLAEQYRSAERRLESTRLMSPVDGIVDQLETFTIGAIATSGEQLLRIVPEDQEVEILANFANTDIGFVEVGQGANINLDAFPSERFGFVRGSVSDVAADSIEIAEGQWAYEVRIGGLVPDELEQGEILELKPGMTSMVDITTGERRLISYFFAPIVDTVQSALGER